MARKAEQVLAVSSPIALNAAGLGAAKVKAVHNEVSADFFRVQISAYHSSKPTVKRVSPPNVEFVGSVPYIRLAGYHQRAEAGIVLYEEARHRTVELSSMKLLEYMACGPPVFSTDVAGQELIRENQIGQFGRRETMSSEFGLFLKQLEGYKRYVDLHRQAIVQTRRRH